MTQFPLEKDVGRSLAMRFEDWFAEVPKYFAADGGIVTRRGPVDLRLAEILDRTAPFG